MEQRVSLVTLGVADNRCGLFASHVVHPKWRHEGQGRKATWCWGQLEEGSHRLAQITMSIATAIR